MCLFVLDEDEVLTYEEVGLLQPSRNQKRPIVLIGKMIIRNNVPRIRK